MGAAVLTCSLAMKKRKRLACDVFATFATWTGIAYDVTDTGCWARNGSSHGCAFAIFRLFFLKQMEPEIVKRSCVSIFVRIPMTRFCDASSLQFPFNIEICVWRAPPVGNAIKYNA